MYSSTSGPMPESTMRGTAAVTSSRVENGASTVAWCSGRGYSFTTTSVTSARVPSLPTMSWVRSYPVVDFT